jgi:transcriptional antiterminator NusG
MSTQTAQDKAASWHVVSITSGFEQSIKNSIESAQEIRGIYKKVFIPVLQAKRFYKNKYYHYNDKVYPGYVFVECYDRDYENLFSHIAIIPGILNMSHFKEIRRVDYPISEEEMNQVLDMVFDKADKYVNNQFKHIQPNQRIKIMDGPFANFEGIVTEIHHSKTKETRLKVCSTFLAGGDITSIVVNASQVHLI